MATTPANVAVALGRPTPATGSSEYRQWQQWITDAELLLAKGDGTHAGLGDLAALDEALLDYVTREAVAAHVRRPDDATSVEVAVDDGRTSRTYQTGVGRVAIRDEWWDMLKPDDQPRASGAFSIRPTYQPDTQPWL